MADESQKQLFESLKDKFQGFDQNGNVIISDNGETTSFSKADFGDLNALFRQANPDAKDGGYEENFNKNQFQQVESAGNKFQGFDDSGNLIYRNEIGDLESFGKQGGFADFARKQMADKKFSMANQGVKNTVAGENTQLNPFQQRQGLGALANLRKVGGMIANPQNVGDQSGSTTPPQAPASAQPYESQMVKQVQEQNKQAAQDKAAAQKQTTTPSLTGMAAGFAADQAKKQATPVLQKAVQPYQQQAQAAKTELGQQVQQATGINPYSSIQNQAVNKVSEMTGINSGILNQGIGAITNPQQAVQNLAKQQVANNLSNLITSNTGADAGITGNLVNTLVSGGNVGNAATNIAKNKAEQMALDYAKSKLANTGLSTALNAMPGGVGAALAGIKALTGKGSTEQKSAAAAQAAARAMAATATGGLSEVVNPETLKAAGSGLTNIKDSQTLNRMGVAGDAVKGVTGLGSGILNTGAELGQGAMNAIGQQGATTGRIFKGAAEGLKQLTKGNIGEGIKGLGSTAIKGALDTFIKNPINVAKSVGSTVGKVASKVGKAIKKLFCFAPDTEILMLDGSYKKIKDLSVGDEVELGGKILLLEVVESDDMYLYEGVEVAGNHAVFEDGKWVRVNKSVKGSALNKSAETYYIITENHVLATKGVIWSDSEEVEDGMLEEDDKTLKQLNSDVRKNKVLKFFQKTKFKQ